MFGTGIIDLSKKWGMPLTYNLFSLKNRRTKTHTSLKKKVNWTKFSTNFGNINSGKV